MKIYQLLTHPKTLNRGLEIQDDRTGRAPVMVDTVSALLSTEGLAAKKRVIANRILSDIGGGAFVDDFLHHELFVKRFWAAGERITSTEIRRELRVPTLDQEERAN